MGPKLKAARRHMLGLWSMIRKLRHARHSELARTRMEQKFMLYGNNLTGSISSSLGNLTNLVNLEPQKNLLSGPIPASLGNVKSLRAAMWSLVTAAALLTGLLALAMPASCNTEGDILFMQRAAWQQPITALDSWDPTLVNPCTWEYVTCDNESHVTHLDLRNVGMSGPLIPELGDLKKLQFMEVFGNGLNGSIPTTLGKLSNLINLDLQDNLLSGTIPASLGAINTLKNIRLHGNNLTGSIPTSLGNLTNLVNLELQKNLLSGPIPASLGNIKTLRSLNLNGNMLTGTVQQEILSLVSDGSLSELNIENTNVTNLLISRGSRSANPDVIGSFWLSLTFLVFL
ncbi:hypothetical protein EJB05_27757, partial [Eragrostis curvula]